MAYPDSLRIVPVFGTLLDLNGEPAGGASIAFRSRQLELSSEDDTAILPGVIVGVANESGQFLVDLPACDDPQWAPQGWTYRVEISGPTWRLAPFEVMVPYTAPVEGISLWDLTPVDFTPGTLYALVNHTHAGGGGGGGGAVDSVFGRTGVVTAQNGDYTKAQVGLGSVDNTSDLNKPISNATQTALNTKASNADLNQLALDTATALGGKSNTGHTHPTGDVVGLDAALAGKSDSGHTHGTSFGSVTAVSGYNQAAADGVATTSARSDHFHGTPAMSSAAATANTPGQAASAGNSSTPARGNHVHSMPAFGTGAGTFCEGNDSRLSDARTPTAHNHVMADVTDLAAALALKAPLADPALTGNPTAPTQTAGNNSTRIATTAFVTAAVAAGGGGGGGAGLPNALTPVTGRYNAFPPGRVSANRTMDVGRGFLAPLPVAAVGSVDRIAIEVAVAGGAGSVCRAVLFSATAGRLPNVSTRDLGTVDTTTTGVKEWTGIAEAVAANTLYWVAFIAQTATFGARAMGAYNPYVSGTSPFSGTGESSHMSMTGLTGAVANGTAYVHNSTENGPLASVRWG